MIVLKSLALVSLSVFLFGCARTPNCDDSSTLDALKVQLSLQIAKFVGSKKPVTITALAPSDKGLDPQTHIRLCTGMASTSAGAPTVTYTVARASSGGPVVQVSNIEPDQAMRDAAVTNAQTRGQQVDLLLADMGNLKQIATALEEYSVDHGGKYTSSFENLKSPYMDAVPTVPESGGAYTIVIPPDPKMGSYEIMDDGSIGGLSSLKTIEGNPCDPSTCQHVIYAQAKGILGGP